MTTTRRDLLRATAATAALAAPSAVTAMASGADEALISAEQEIARLIAELEAYDRDADIEDGHPLWDRWQELEWFIIEAAPVTLAGAAVKLRRLLDVGIMAGCNYERDIAALGSVLVLLERLAAEAGFGLPPRARPIATLADVERDAALTKAARSAMSEAGHA